MGTCENCGNEYDKAFQVVMKGETHTVDSFECAIHALAPTCKHCGTRIVGMSKRISPARSNTAPSTSCRS